MKTQSLILLIVGCVAILGLVLGLAFALVFKKGPDLSAYLPLREPRIAQRPNERVLEVEFSGPADTVIKKAYSVLFKSYFGLKGSPKGPAMKSPKARYWVSAAKDEANQKRLTEFLVHDWKGSVAIPIPEGLPVTEGRPDAEGMAARVGAWDYGEVAEILHLGSYETEPPTIAKLEDYIRARGYRIVEERAGEYLHEEDYLKGPGMAFVSPKDYWTIIRYRVEKAE
jgi:effector-binding domain-containing protein